MADFSLKNNLIDSFSIASGQDFSGIDASARRYDGLFPLSEPEGAGLKSYKEAFDVRMNYDTNAIEGSTLTLAETAVVVEGEVLPDRPTRFIYAAKGIAEANEYVDMLLKDDPVEISQGLIKDIHERVAQDIEVPNRGIYRSEPVYIRGSNTTTSNVSQIRGHMDDLLYAYRNSPLHPIEKSAAFHVFFENIHPFRDGNGRTGRLVLNLMLQNDGYVPVNLKNEHRAEYLQALEDWQGRGEREPFLSMLKEAEAFELEERIAAIMEAREAQRALT